MTRSTPEAFIVAARNALARVDVPEQQLTLLDAKGLSFDLYEDGGVDSLDMLDVAFYIDHDLNIKLGLEMFVESDEPKTVQNLYNSIR